MVKRLLLIATLALLATFGLSSGSALAASCAPAPTNPQLTTHYDPQFNYFFGSQNVDCGTRDIATVQWRVRFKTTDGMWVSAWEAYQNASYTSSQHKHVLILGDNNTTGCGLSNLHIFAMEFQANITFISGTFPNSLDWTQNDTAYHSCDPAQFW